ncbi:type II secretion system secretin GspD [Parachitinimonas caeni]|uniref:Type II secretion system secretin GspD n=1 Tax=Parachitinimonas caeni TaxID=3031301 RepID=A0ABT7DS27_9NEIS|nr:type II secretion system secretin GspD [Parachitinimonas caeni]MDK2122870.1 type II secretion system secretin GspD [Parachitinimonas caeni]
MQPLRVRPLVQALAGILCCSSLYAADAPPSSGTGSLLDAIRAAQAQQQAAGGKPPANPFAVPAKVDAKPEAKTDTKPAAQPVDLPKPPAAAAKATADIKPVAAKPGEIKPAETKPADAKPAEAKLVDTKAAPDAVPSPDKSTATAEAKAETKPVSKPQAKPIAARREVSILPPGVSQDGGGVTVRFDNADIYEVVQTILGDILHLDYIVDPGVNGKVNLNSVSPVSQADLFQLLQSVLAYNGVSIIRDGNLYKVVRDASAPRDTIGGSAVGEGGAVLQIVPMKFMKASALVNVLKSFVGPNATIQNDPTDRYLIIADRANNVKKLIEMIQVLDLDYLKQVQIKLIQVAKGDATELAKEMETMFKSSTMFNISGTDANKVSFMPIKRMNAILIIAQNEALLGAAENWLKVLDDEPKQGIGNRINIYQVRNSTAEHLANMVGQIYGAAPTSSGSSSSSTTSSSGQAPSRVVQKGAIPVVSAAGGSGDVQIIANEKNNSLIIKASPQDYLQIRKILESLDTVPRQVLIQANIVEVALTGSKKFGLEWWLNNEGISIDGRSYKSKGISLSGDGKTATFPFPSVNPGYGMGNTPIGSGRSGGLLYTILDAANNPFVLLQALASDSDVNIISSPRVMATDGKEATFEIIDSVATKTGSSTNSSGGLSETFQYKDAGIIFKFKPSINDSGLVQLELSGEVSEVADTSAANGANGQPRFKKRKVNTEITLQEGKTLLISGFIKEKRSNGSNGIPYVKDIPFLGGLFGADSKEVEKTELIFTVTPYIVRNAEDADRVGKLQDEALAQVKSFTNQLEREKNQQPPQKPAK